MAQSSLKMLYLSKLNTAVLLLLAATLSDDIRGVGCNKIINSETSRTFSNAASAKEYYYTRTREDPNHLRVSEEFKNHYINEIKYVSKINGTKYEYYKSSLTMSHDELVFETIDKMFRHRLSPFYVHHYDRNEDKKRSFDPALVSREACGRDLLYLVDKLPKRAHAETADSLGQNGAHNPDEDHLTPELTAFFDSYGRQEAGLMMGNIYWVGAYDQCINRHIFELTGSQHPDLRKSGAKYEDDQQVISFKGRYCVAALKSPAWDAIISDKIARGKHYFKSDVQLDNYPKLFRLQVGVCLPSSCDSTTIDRHAGEIKFLATAMLEQRYADYELADLYCLPDEASPLRSWSGSALYFLIFVAIWSAMILLATIADVFGFNEALDSVKTRKAAHEAAKQTGVQRFVEWFSLKSNYHKMMRVGSDEVQQAKKNSASANPPANTANATPPKSPRKANRGAQASEQHSPKKEASKQKSPTREPSTDIKVNLRFLNAFKVLIMFWIINGHIMLLMIQTAKNILYSDALLNGLMHLLIGATFGVDLFFTMTGFLTSYLIFNSGRASRMRLLDWLGLSVHRYWRLAPLYLIAFWFSRSVVQLLGAGPLWDYGTSSLTFRGLCNHESWWYPLTLTSNLHGLFEECMITSWYISCDMQFWLASPLFVHLLSRRPLYGWAATVAAIAWSSKARFHGILSEQSARYDELVQPRADIFMRVSHDLPALYTHPQYRISSYLVGLLAGHFVYMVKTGKWSSGIVLRHGAETGQQASQASGPHQQAPVLRSSNTATNKLHCHSTVHHSSSPAGKARRTRDTILQRAMQHRSLVAYLGLLLLTVMSFVSYICSHFYPNSMLKHAKLAAALAHSVDHLVMSIGASLIIITMCFGQWPRLVHFLSHPNWTRLSKMNYALLLIQCEAIYFQIFRYDQIPVAGTKELINILFNLLVTLYPLAFVVTLAFEFPLANIEKLLFKMK